MLVEGGVRVAPHVMVFGDLGWLRNLQIDLAPTLNTTMTYRYSRIAADPTLSAAPLNTNGMTFGLGYRF